MNIFGPTLRVRQTRKNCRILKLKRNRKDVFIKKVESIKHCGFNALSFDRFYPIWHSSGKIFTDLS